MMPPYTAVDLIRVVQSEMGQSHKASDFTRPMVIPALMVEKIASHVGSGFGRLSPFGIQLRIRALVVTPSAATILNPIHVPRDCSSTGSP